MKAPEAIKKTGYCKLTTTGDVFTFSKELLLWFRYIEQLESFKILEYSIFDILLNDFEPCENPEKQKVNEMKERQYPIPPNEHILCVTPVSITVVKTEKIPEGYEFAKYEVPTNDDIESGLYITDSFSGKASLFDNTWVLPEDFSNSRKVVFLRKKAPKAPEINWPDWIKSGVWLARDADGDTAVFLNKPEYWDGIWSSSEEEVYAYLKTQVFNLEGMFSEEYLALDPEDTRRQKP